MDGTTATTQWKGLHDVLETVHSYNPENGWLQNCNSTPYSVAGVKSKKTTRHGSDGESFRGLNAIRLLSKETTLTN
jgi:acyl-homoserine lactone acylase PvdQ